MHNVEAWAEVISDVVDLVPEEHRAEVVALVAAIEKRERKKREKDPFITASEVDFLASPGVQNWHTIMRLTSLVVQVCVRRISNNHHPKDAAAILFAEHPYGYGSGQLRDYLDKLI
jgi:hypothetical protein